MTARVRWTRPALRHLEEIQDFIAADDPRAAFDVAERIRTLVQSELAEFPMAGREGRIEGTRELVIADIGYIVAYRVRDNDVEILALKHGAQRWPRSL